MFGQRQDVVSAFAKGWNANGKHSQTEVQIFAKFAVFHSLLQVLVGGSHDAHIAVNGAQRAQSFHHLVLQNSQQFGLQLEWHFTNFIQEQGAAIGLFKLARLGFNGPSEGAFFVAKQGGFEQVFWNGGAVNGDVRLASAV